MKTATIFLIVLFPVASLAQNYPNINQGDMQLMMRQMQKMQTCMENVDQTRLKTLEQQSNQFQKDMKALCASGKREAAQAKAIEFGREVAADPAMQTMRKCGEMMKGMVPKMPGMEETMRDYSTQHVCDSL